MGLFFVFGMALGQNVETMYQQELDKMVQIPNSPEARAFAKYGNSDVSLHTGTPNINIPLYTIKGREMDLPVNLTYDASGIKVEQLATWVGLGWNLNLGGRITRMTNGLADDYIDGAYQSMNNPAISNTVADYLANTSLTFSSEQAVRDYFNFLNDINKNLIDTQPDIYQVSAPGLNTTIVLDPQDNNEPKSLDNPRIRIDNVYRESSGNGAIIGWKITNENGTTYTFGATSITNPVQPYETTRKYGNDYAQNGAIINVYNSSWMLASIESSNSKDLYEFGYHDDGEWSQEQQASSAGRIATPLVNNQYYYPINSNSEQYGSAGYWIGQQFLDTVKHNGHTLISVNRGNRYDLNNTGTDTRLDQINIYDYQDNLLKNITFDNANYFNEDAISPNGSDPLDYLEIRLKLDGISIKDKNLSTVEGYYFEYDRPNYLPARTDKGQDFAGYYNGANNAVLFERYEQNGYLFAGADRQPNENVSTIGLLNKIVYPTGGYTEFAFEGNKGSTSENNQILVEKHRITINGDDPDNNHIYVNEFGQLADEKYLPGIPKVKVSSFTIQESDNYQLDFAGTASESNVEAFLLYLGGRECGDCVENFDPIIYKDFTNPGWEIGQNNLPDVHKVWPYPNTIQFTNQFYFSTDVYGIDLPAGRYKLLLLLDGEGDHDQSYGSAYVRISRYENRTSSQTIEYGGVRLASMKDYESTGSFAQGKNYEYKGTKRHFNPNLSVIESYNGNQSLVRYASRPSGSMPIVTYDIVDEYIVDVNNNSEGMVRNYFYSDMKGLMPENTKPFESNYYPGVTSGKLERQIVFNSEDEKVSSKEIEYFETHARPVKVEGLSVFYDDNHLGDFIYITENSNGSYGYDHVTANDCSGPGQTYSPTFGINFCNPLPCVGTNFEGCEPYIGLMVDSRLGGLRKRSTFVNGAYGGVSVQRDSLFYNYQPLGSTYLDVIGKLKETQYEEEYYLPEVSTTTDSKGKRVRSTYTYPHQNGNEYIALVNKNNLSVPVSAKTELIDGNGNVLEFMGATRTEYASYGNAVLPTKIFTSKKGESALDLEERINYTYYTNGNLRESVQLDGPTSTYVWGYEDMLPVAKVDNATHAQVSVLGFDQNVLTSLSSSDEAKREELQDLRNGLPGALATTYTYFPSVGRTSVTDPRGNTNYYHYDDFSRLLNIKDADGHLLKEYEYDYRNINYVSPEEDTFDAVQGTINGSNSVEYGASSSYSVAVTGGSGNFEYTWYEDGMLNNHGSSSTNFDFINGSEKEITVIITDNVTGNQLMLTKQVDVYANLGSVTLSPSPSHAYTGDLISFQSSGISGSYGNLDYQWEVVGSNEVEDFDESTGFETSFNGAGTYTIRLTVSHPITGDSVFGEVAVTIYPPLNIPVLSPQVSHKEINSHIHFTTSNVGGGSGDYSYKWFVDPPGPGGFTQISTQSYSFDINKLFNDLGTHIIKFVVVDDITQRTEEVESTVHIYEAVQLSAIAVADQVDVGETFSMSVPVATGGSGSFTYEWTATNVITGATISWGPFTESNRNISRSLNSNFDAISVQIKCTVRDVVLNKGVSSTKTITVGNHSSISRVTVRVTDIEPDPEAETLRLVAGVSGGSGDYTYRWVLNGSVAQEGSSNAYEYIYLNCSNQSTTVTCVVIDNITNQTVPSTTRTHTYDGQCL